MLYDVDNQHYFLSFFSALSARCCCACRGFCFRRAGKGSYKWSWSKLARKFLRLEGYNSRGCAFRKSPQRRLLGVADRAWKGVERFVNDQVLGIIDWKALTIKSELVILFFKQAFAAYSLFVSFRIWARISGSSQLHAFICSSRVLPAVDSEKYISRLSTFPMTREIRAFFSTAQIIFDVLEQVRPKASAISPAVKLLFSESRHRSIPSLMFTPWSFCISCSKAEMAR